MKKLFFIFMSVLLLFGLDFTFASSTLAETTYDQEELAVRLLVT
ncbi:hypothetical protein [Metabacillus sp. FJAT-52054]|uniref:Uncharacterized protein n=1 Tax=Metabacillus sediminis TaxID=3117746 RepID=A0ABZ2NIN2_9BACI